SSTGTHSSLCGLAIYLIACHHAKVRTVLRSNPPVRRKGQGNTIRASTRPKDVLFGIKDGDELPAVPGLLSASMVIPTEPRRVGVTGNWDDARSTFTTTGTSWVELVTDLLGGLHIEQ